MIKKCLECGSEFDSSEGGYNENHMIYCSIACGRKYRYRIKAAERLHKVICSECGTEFETTRANTVCCSPKCVKERNRRRSREVGEMYRAKYREEKKNKNKSKVDVQLHEFEAEARKHGLSYGKLEMMRQIEKDRAERLKRGTA